MGEDEETADSIAERFHVFTRRNIILVSVFFLSNLITSVSTLVTAVTVFRDSREDWRPAEYRMLRELRAGHTLERFKEKLGTPAFRVKDPIDGHVSNIFQPRRDYWVEAISDETDVTLTYVVTSCDKKFRPKFSFRDSDNRPTVTLNETPLSGLLPSGAIRKGSISLFPTGSGSVPGSVFQVVASSASTDYRSYAWGLNGTCRPWISTPPGADLVSEWEDWYFANDAENIFPYENLGDTGAKLADRSTINTFAESALHECMLDLPDDPCESSFYTRQIGVDPVVVR